MKRTVWLLLLALIAPVAHAAAPWERVAPARELLGENQPLVGAIVLDMPAVTHDGSSVPVRVSLNRRAGFDEPVELLYLFTTGNPSPEVAEFRFGHASGPLDLETRIRLAGSQQVFALARTASGQWLAGQREIRVTVSGCLVDAQAQPGEDFMTALVRTPSRLRPGYPIEIRSLIRHPMETGQRSDQAGRPIPRRIVDHMLVELQGESVLEARFHPAVAAHPYLRFQVAADHHGELKFYWRDSEGEQATATARIPAS